MVSERRSRRQFLTGMAGAGLATLALASPLATPGRKLYAASRGPRRTLEHKVKHEGPQFAQGHLLGARLQAGSLHGPGRFESPVVLSPFAFTGFALRWLDEDQPSAELEVRTSADGVTWTGWRHVHAEVLPTDSISSETHSSLLIAPRHLYLQYGVNLGDAARLGRITTIFLNSSDGPLVAGATTLDEASCTSPTDVPVTFTREQCLFNPEYFTKNPVQRTPIGGLFAHHTASSSDFPDTEAGKEYWRNVYYLHAVSNGWGDIGYHAGIDHNGNIFEGARYLSGTSEDDPGCGRGILADGRGTHAAANNTMNLGAALFGDFTWMEPSSEAIAAFERLATYWCRRHRIDVSEAWSYLRSDGVFNKNQKRLVHHGGAPPNNTACCGTNFISKLGGIRERVYGASYDPSATVVQITKGPNGVTLTGNASVTFEWTGTAASYEICLFSYGVDRRTYDLKDILGLDAEGHALWTTVTSKSRTYSGLKGGRHYQFLVRPGGAGFVRTASFLKR